MLLNPKEASNEQLLSRAVALLLQGVVPYTNWSCVFANPKLSEWPALQAKAFDVWFPTMLDYLSGRDESRAVMKELDLRKAPYEDVFDLSERLEQCFKTVLSMYSVEEQVFVWDRRLQNVHGKLQVDVYETHNVRVYDAKISNRELSAEEYRRILIPFYRDLPRYSKEFIGRLLGSNTFSELTGLFNNQLNISNSLAILIKRLGVFALAGNG
jgi:hypothetical protein